MRFGPILLPVLLLGCAAPKVEWYSKARLDQITDDLTCVATVGSIYTGRAVYEQAGDYYPFVAVRNRDVRVGVRSSGQWSVPVGSVQLRIDNNPHWTIDPSETPIDLRPQRKKPDSGKAEPGEPDEDAFAFFYDMASAHITRVMSPYTATTGEKAHAIINEMVKGKKLKYRIIGPNQASTTGEIDLDASFVKSLTDCRIPFQR